MVTWVQRRTFGDLFSWLCLWKNVTWKMLGEHFLASTTCYWSDHLIEISPWCNKVSSADLSAASSYANYLRVIKTWAACYRVGIAWRAVLLGKGHERKRSLNGYGLVNAILKASHVIAWPWCPEQTAAGERVEPQEDYKQVKMFMASSSQLGCYLKECIIPCCIFWPAQGAFIRAAGRERDSALESSRGFPQHLGLKEPLTVHLAKCFLWAVKICISQTKGVWNVLRARWCTMTNRAVAMREGVTAGAPQSCARTPWSYFWGPGVYLSRCGGGDKPQTQSGFSPRGTNLSNPAGFGSKQATFCYSISQRRAGPLAFFSSKVCDHIRWASQRVMEGCTGRDGGPCVTAHGYNLHGDSLSWEPWDVT